MKSANSCISILRSGSQFLQLVTIAGEGDRLRCSSKAVGIRGTVGTGAALISFIEAFIAFGYTAFDIAGECGVNFDGSC